MAGRLNNLGLLHSDLFEAVGDVSDLRKSISIRERAITLLAENGPILAKLLTNVGVDYVDLYEVDGDIDSLREGLGYLERSASLVVATSPDRPSILNNLGLCLATLYQATGSREYLELAISRTAEAVELSLPGNSASLTRINNLANYKESLHQVTGDPQILHEAIDAVRQVIELTPAESPDLPTRLNNLATFLASLAEVSGDPVHLARAIDTATEAVSLTPELSPDMPGLLSNLSHWLLADGDTRDSGRALSYAEQAVELSPHASPERLNRQINLAMCKITIFEEGGDSHHLADAEAILPPEYDAAPSILLGVERTRAAIRRLQGRPGDAAIALEKALRAYDSEMARLSQTPVQLRDLAGLNEGLVGDMACSLARAGDHNGAVRLVESDRTWLKAPPGSSIDDEANPPSVVWVVASRWETMILSGDATSPIFIDEISVETITRKVGDIHTRLRAWHSDHATDPMPAFDAVLDVTSAITRYFPDNERILIVPVGICSLLPYAAGSTPSGDLLIERAEITISPSLMWSNQSASKAPVNQKSVGVFCPGRGKRYLELEPDQATFESLFPSQRILQSPSAEETIDCMANSGYVSHLSCHGSYDYDRPLRSSLYLEDELTLERVLSLETVSWLVNLSACETALLDLSRAEQSLSFPVAFIRSGASHVIGTLWPVLDDDASAYNQAFYNAWVMSTRQLRIAGQCSPCGNKWREDRPIHELWCRIARSQ